LLASFDCALLTDGSTVPVWVFSCAAIGSASWLMQVELGPPAPLAGQRFSVIPWPMAVVGKATAPISATAERPAADRRASLLFSKDI